MSTKRLLSGRRRLTTDEAALKIYEALDTPVSLSMWILLSNGEYEQLLRKSVNPRSYGWTMAVRPTNAQWRGIAIEDARRATAELFRRDYQAVKLLSKLDRKIPGIDRRAAAILRWKQAEESNRLANMRLSFSHDRDTGAYYRHPDYGPFSEHLFVARKIIEKTLGAFSWSTAVGFAAFGPGTTRQSRGKKSDISSKYSAHAGASPRTFLITAHLIGMTPSWFESLTGVSPDGPCCYLGLVADDAVSVSFVDKTALTDRSIGIGPLMNIYLQKGIGRIIRNALKRKGINLDSQSANQLAAMLAWFTGDACTIDLSNASDSMCIALIRELLPDDWFRALYSCRERFAEFTQEDLKADPSLQKQVLLEKFSSMGNGYTFELETLVFWALAKACEQLRGTTNQVLVYGDDIVVHPRTAEELIPLLSFCGFSTNEDKTFLSGEFFESCGKDYFCGYDVRPFFIRKELSDVSEFYTLANQLRCSDLNDDHPHPSRVYASVYGRVYHSVCPNYRFVVPPSWGFDTGFHVTFERLIEFYPQEREIAPGYYGRVMSQAVPWVYNQHKDSREKGWGGYHFSYWQAYSATVYRDRVGALVGKLDKLYRQERCGPLTTRALEYLEMDAPVTGNELPIRAISVDPDERFTRRRQALGYCLSWC